MHSLVALVVVSFLLSTALTPIVRNFCRRYGLVDQPGLRKIHKNAIPRSGGIAVALAYLLAYGILLATGAKAGDIIWAARADIGRLVPAAAFIFLLGLADDIWGFSAAPKLLCQTAAAVYAYSFGVRLGSLGGHTMDGWLSLPVTVFWLLACTNALNLIDGLDGLAASIGLFAAATTLAAALIQHNIGLALAVVPLVGALIGFLRYNFSPATIFLGDSGSLFTGFLLGCFGVLWSQKSATLLGMTAPMMVLAIPLLDTSLAIARRFLRNKPIFSADRGHIHHRLLDRGLTPRKVVLILYACCAVAAICSLAVMHSRSAEAVIVVFCSFIWFGVRYLGYREFNLFGRIFHPRNFRPMLQAQLRINALEDTLAGAETVDDCWVALRHTSQELGFSHLVMRLDHTFYEERLGGEPTWTIRVPLSKTEFINIGHDPLDTVPPGIVGPLAEMLRRALVPKLPGFQAGLAVDAQVRVVKYGRAATGF
jgi:UDP-GlcNAc:undecaprenyl-phosphate GlcNAc-1-phosphate transferase